VAKSCREPIAEEVTEKTRANFCDYFQPRPAAYLPPDVAAARQARAQLKALFGGASGEGSDTVPSATDAARKDLEQLFGTDKT
jgi:hypothetical protein